jgi:hypothetical protein
MTLELPTDPATNGTYSSGGSVALALTVEGVEALNRFADTPAARALDRLEHEFRLEADRELLTTIGLESFDGAVTRQLRDALIEYGYAVIGAWLNPHSDRMYIEAIARGFGTRDFERRFGFSDDHRHDLLMDVVLLSVPSFLEKVLATGRWDHRKGASIKTFFMGWCVIQFPNVFRKFLRDHVDDFKGNTELGDFDRPSNGHDPSSILVDFENERRLFTCASRDTTMRQILWYRPQGYTNAEIEDLLGGDLTVGAIESRLHRWKRANPIGGNT